MKRFFDVTFRPFFVLTGVGTALAGLYAFWPRWAAETISRLTFVPEDTITVQHWGIMVGLMGVFIIVAAFRADWRKPILIYSGTEKAFMVYLVASNLGHAYADGYRIGAVMDATVVLLGKSSPDDMSLLGLLWTGNHKRCLVTMQQDRRLHLNSTPPCGAARCADLKRPGP